MGLQRVLSFARTLLERAVKPEDAVVDATVGNGHDTVFLAQLVGEQGRVYGFDIQTEAIEQTKLALESKNLMERVSLYDSGHESLLETIPFEEKGKITGAIFNLGYLPGGDKSIVTHAETTISAIEQLLELMPKGGIVVLVIYHGHAAGAIERDALLDYAINLPQEKVHVLQYGFINQKNNPPFILAIEKK
ncbi:class I SAM-dependent methyltransferase [Lederbergia citrea]|uniref:Class I SAM-dependent methyltransferase n=1 Tax=Lederbergia citrea TaxID=2833581 RepID=A0A942UNX6_9BACI|nr:class I SAM-dependent methyltransferase [Lederbergia citrea]MBS4175945.1 class I SAM-dependent methyltransferase [Lederbergia citrea]MBS4202505.1 class I SAM-dependent methyltransferase [Lederbergia citrea]MBS4222827.1 class I SAM-dependent methyltransferase [Lederbergia citrea]